MSHGFVDLETLPFYPASYDLDNLVGVAASGQFDELARFSNYSSDDIDLAAPGVGILSTFPRDQGEYSLLSGTSFATPQVSGTAALIWSELPDATVAEVREALLEGVDSIDGLDGKVVTGGRLNAHGSLTVDTYRPRAVLTTAADVTSEGGTTHDLTIDYTDNVAIKVSSIDDNDIIVRRQDGTGSAIAATNLSVTPEGNGADRTAVYRIVPPGGSWDSAENGDWDVVLRGGQLRDTSDNASLEQVLGSFNVDIPLSGPFNVTSFSDTVDADPGDGLSFRRSEGCGIRGLPQGAANWTAYGRGKLEVPALDSFRTDHDCRKPDGATSEQHQTHARLFQCCPSRLHDAGSKLAFGQWHHRRRRTSIQSRPHEGRFVSRHGLHRPTYRLC